MAVFLISGGQDSVTCAALGMSLKPEDRHHFLTFHYGQRHSVEVRAAAKCVAQLSELYGCTTEHHVFVLDVAFKTIAGGTSDLLAESGRIEEGIGEQGSEKLPSSFVPGRNMIFLSIATSYAAARGLRDVFCGVCGTDFSGYPDCRREFISRMEGAAGAAFDHPQFRQEGGKAVVIHTPLMTLDKAQTFALAERLGPNVLKLVIEETQTDYYGETTQHEWGRGSGISPACKLRMAGWKRFKEGDYPYLPKDLADLLKR
jgi:7-cyano-7-deazaguanine synthase